VFCSQMPLLFQSLVLLGCLCIPCFTKIHIVFLRISDSFLATRMHAHLSFVLAHTLCQGCRSYIRFVAFSGKEHCIFFQSYGNTLASKISL
jgi:hypothetical protein